MKETMIALVALAFPLSVLLQSMPAVGASAEKMKQKTSEAVDATSEYAQATAKETKEEFQTRMKKNLDVLDQKINELEKQVSSATDETRKDLNAQLDRLEKQRTDISKQLDAASKKSGRAWDKFKVGLERAWAELKSGYSSAKAEYDKKETKSE